ncbi:unnamed protein product [Caenorhabditis bovis]|uniref:Neurotransmitter-gated ion-channel ligand-binding domain-containing protein n=1 Tax=Caenorhabditis bovis TaxID=2654633 RepID=A0A8S1EVZ4_9PELO|nr:unnamed protein product [Caenorhabditis bovis]
MLKFPFIIFIVLQGLMIDAHQQLGNDLASASHVRLIDDEPKSLRHWNEAPIGKPVDANSEANAVIVTGRLFCRGQPAKYMRPYLASKKWPDAMLAIALTQEDGSFRLNTGSFNEFETTPIDFEIRHQCETAHVKLMTKCHIPYLLTSFPINLINKTHYEVDVELHATSKYTYSAANSSLMRLLAFIRIEERETSICGIRIPNKPLAVLLALFQLSICIASFLQHIYSLHKHNRIFLCNSNITMRTANFSTHFLAHDIIIFDFGLMHRVLGTNECVANYLDGGYMRFAWTIEQSTALTISLVSLLCVAKPLWLLWPGLLMQSSYTLGLSVLTMATAPKILEALGGVIDLELALIFFVYCFGFVTNWIFTFVLWHYYWHRERKFQAELGIYPPPTFI